MPIFAIISAAVSTFGIPGVMAGSTISIGSFALGKMGSFLARTAMGLALNAMSKPKTAGATSQGYTVTQRGSAIDHQIIYGKTKAAGVVVFDGTTGSNNKYLHRVIAYTGHEITEYSEIWLNDYKLTLDSNGEVTNATDPQGNTTDRYNGYVRIKKHLGSVNQTADSTLISEVTDWTSAHRLRGVAYLYVRLKFKSDVFPNGIPEIQATIKGKKVYDPRTSTTGWSDNPALILRDYLMSDYGLGEASAQIDDDAVKSAANRCDETAANSDAFFTCNGSFTTAQTPYDVIQDLLSSMVGELWYAQGEWRMKAADYATPTISLTEDDLRGSMAVSTRHARRDNFNVIKGTWRGEDSDWQITDYPEYKDSQAVTDDGGQEAVMDFPLPFTDNSDECQRIARILYERQRQQLIVKASFGLRAFKLQVGDTVNLTNARMGWTNKVFEVTDFSFGVEGENNLVVDLVLRETAASVYDEISNYVTYERDNTTLASPFDTQSISGVSAVASSSLNGDGTVVPKLKWTWSVDDQSDVDYYIFGWRIGASGTYNEHIVKDRLFEIEPAVSGATYYYSIKSVNHRGVQGQASTGSLAAGGDTTAPATPTGLTAVGGYKQVTLSWDQPTESDFKHMRVQRLDVTWQTIGYASGTGFIDDDRAHNTSYSYRIRAEDYSGNASANTTSQSATTLTEIQGEAGDDGARGAGSWKIFLTTANMPAIDASDSTINSKFTTAVGTPVDRDQAWFTDDSTLEQRVWIYDSSDSSWTYQEFSFDGNVVVDGTITSSKIDVDNLSAISANLGDVVIENTLQLEAGGAGFIGGRNSSSQYDSNGFYIARTDLGGGSKGFEVSHTSVYDSKISGIIHSQGQNMQVFNPDIYIGGSTTEVSFENLSTNQTKNIGEADEVVLTVVGGGGGGGYGQNDGGGSGRGGTGGTTTVKVYHTSVTASNLIATVQASGGLGGLNGAGVGTGSGTSGQSTSYGSGGAGGARNNAGSDADTNAFGAGGGGGGGDASSLFDSSGQAGQGGSAGQIVNQTVDTSSYSGSIYLVTTIGSGGTGGNGDHDGGDGAKGVVSYASPLAGARVLPAKEIADIKLAAAMYRTGTATAFNTAGTGTSGYDRLYLFEGMTCSATEGDIWLGGNGRIITAFGYGTSTNPNSSNNFKWNHRDFVSSSSQNYRSSSTSSSASGDGMFFFEAGTYMDTDRNWTWNNLRILTSEHWKNLEDIARSIRFGRNGY